MEDLEFTRPAGEYPPPAAEFARDPMLEFGQVPEEFPTRATTAEEPAPEKKRRLKKIFLGVAAAALMVFLCVHTGTVPLPERIDGPEPTPPAESALPAATETPHVTETPDATETPEPTEEPAPTFPLGDGTVVVTVYNNTMDFSGVDWENFTPGEELVILLREEIPESEFTELELPPAVIGASDEEYWDWAFAGYALDYNNEMDEGYRPGSPYAAFVTTVSSPLTREDVELVPPGDDGVRYVNIHVLWRSIAPEKYEEWEYKLKLVLDDGLGHETAWEGDTPYASEGYTYLAAYPVPEREGYTFTGWYNEDGEKVEFLTYFDFFANPHLVETEDGSYMDADWDQHIPVELTAGWKKNP